jgi:hypothetical protein
MNRYNLHVNIEPVCSIGLCYAKYPFADIEFPEEL